MQNKKLYFVLAVVVVLAAAAAFVGGRLLNGGVSPLGLSPMMGVGQVAFSVEIIPAPELPKTEPETRGSFVERKDNIIVLQNFSMEAGGGGIVVSRISGGSGEGPITNESGDKGHKVEAVITNKTIIYRDATEMIPPSEAKETATIQQIVEEGSLDDLNSDSMLMVWGRKNGDRIIADMIVYSQPVIFKRGAP